MKMETKADAELRKAILGILAVLITTQNIDMAVASVESLIMDRVTKMADDLNRQYKQLVDNFNKTVDKDFIPVKKITDAVNEVSGTFQEDMIDLGVKLTMMACMDTKVAGGSVILNKLVPAVKDEHTRFVDMLIEYDHEYLDASDRMKSEYDKRLQESLKYCRKSLRGDAG